MKLTKTMRLVCLAAVLIVATGSSPALAYTVNGHAECTMAGWAPYGAVVKAFEVDPLPGGSYTVNSPELATATVNASGNFTLTFPWPSGGGFEVGGPDIIFVFTQNINGSAEIIYEENASGTRWNVADATTIPLNVASPLAVCSNPAVTPSSVPNNKLFCLQGSAITRRQILTLKGVLLPVKAIIAHGKCRTVLPEQTLTSLTAAP